MDLPPNLNLSDLFQLLQDDKHGECVAVVKQLLDYHRAHWVYLEKVVAAPTVCTSKLKPFVDIAQLPPEGREPFPASYIAANRQNARVTLSNEILNIAEYNIDKYPQLYVAQILLIALFLFTPLPIMETKNQFIDGISPGETATNIPAHLQKMAHNLYEDPFIDRLDAYIISTRLRECVAFTRTSLEFYLQHNRQ